MYGRMQSQLLWVAFIAMTTVSILPGNFQVDAGSDCDKPVLPNGKSTWKEGKTAIKYTCYDPFSLYGTNWDYCVNYTWVLPLPACVASGCPDVNITDPLIKTYVLMEEAVIEFECPPETWLNGSYHSWCNGTHWSDPPPSCVEMVCPEVGPKTKSAEEETPSNGTETTDQTTHTTNQPGGNGSTNGTGGNWVNPTEATNQTCVHKGGGCESSALLIAVYTIVATFAALIPVVLITVRVTLWMYGPRRMGDAKSPDETKPIATNAAPSPQYTQ